MQGNYKSYLGNGRYPKRGRGLGAINLKRHNEALMLNSMHKFFNKLNISSTNLIMLERTITVGSEPPIYYC